MNAFAALEKPHFLNREESFMYDREVHFPMEDTCNDALIEYTEKGIQYATARRCQLIRIGRSKAVVAIATQFALPETFYLRIIGPRINKIGCLRARVSPKDTMDVRFLTHLAQRDLDRIFVYSTHPAHRGRLLDLRG